MIAPVIALDLYPPQSSIICLDIQQGGDRPTLPFSMPSGSGSNEFLFTIPISDPVKPDPLWTNVLLANANRAASLKEGWDGHGSVPISEYAIFTATSITKQALGSMPQATAPYLVPGGDGSLQIEWHEKHGELELDINPNGSLSIWGRDHRTGAEFEGFDEEALNLFFRWAPWMASVSSDVVDASVSEIGSSLRFAA